MNKYVDCNEHGMHDGVERDVCAECGRVDHINQYRRTADESSETDCPAMLALTANVIRFMRFIGHWMLFYFLHFAAETSAHSPIGMTSEVLCAHF